MNKSAIGILLLATLLISGCTNPGSAKKLLEDNGYTQVQITGYKPFACSDDDYFHTGFVAMSPAGKPVSGVVCSGILKGSTIRFD